MCVVSYIGDDWTRRFPKDYPWYPGPYTPVNPLNPGPIPINPPINPDPSFSPQPTPSQMQDQINKLRQDLEALKELLLAAKKYDELTGQPDCHVDEKVGLIKKIAEAMGVDFSEVFGEDK